MTTDNLTLAIGRRVAVAQAIAPDLDLSPGSDLYDEIVGNAGGSALVMYSLQNILLQQFIRSAYGSGLDSWANNYGLSRNPATFATIVMTVQGAAGAPSGGWIVPQNTHFFTVADANGTAVVFLSTAQVTVQSSSTAAVTCIAQLAGTSGNVAANAVSQMDGVTGVSVQSSAAPVTLAVDVEADTALQSRILAKNFLPYSDAAVLAAALSVSGVAAAYVNDPRDHSGALTVYAAQADGTLGTLSSAIQSAVQAIMVVTTTAAVSAFTLVYAAVAVSIEVASGYSSATVQAGVISAILAWAQTLTAGQTVQPGPMWKYVISNVLGLADWYTTSAIPTVASTSLFRFLAAPSGVAQVANASGGSLAAGTVYFKYTWSGAAGETLPTAEVSVTVVLNGSVTVTAPAVFPSGITHLNIYMGTTPGGEQNQGFISTVGGSTTLTTVSAGGAPPSSGTISQPTVTVVTV